MNELDERIRRVMGAVFDVDPSKITDEAAPGTIEKWDSLRHMNLVLALEDEFSVKFTDDEMLDILDFKTILLLLKMKQGGANV